MTDEATVYVITASDRRIRSVLGARSFDGQPVDLDSAARVARAIGAEHHVETIVVLVRTKQGDGPRWIVDVESGDLVRDPAT